LMQYEEAIASGALAFFGEKYGSEVRVVRMGDFSTELCGGTHVRNTAEIGFFKIIAETSIASGVRRIEATTRHHALRHVQKQQQELLHMAKTLKTTPDALESKVAEVLAELQQKDKSSQQLKARLAQLQARALWQNSRKIAGIPIILGLLDDIDAKSLRLALDEIKGRGEPFVAVLASENEGMVNIVVGVSKDVAQRLPATAIIAHLGEQTGVKGGGRSDMAQAGGAKLLDFQKAMEQLPQWLEGNLPSC